MRGHGRVVVEEEQMSVIVMRRGVDDALDGHAQLVMEPRGHQERGRVAGHADRRRKAKHGEVVSSAPQSEPTPGPCRRECRRAGQGRERSIGMALRANCDALDGQATQRVLT